MSKKKPAAKKTSLIEMPTAATIPKTKNAFNLSFSTAKIGVLL